MLTDKFGKTVGIIIQLLGMFLMYGVHIYAAKILGAESYGSLNIILAYGMILSTTSMFGSSYYLPVYNEHGLDKLVVSFFIVISVVISLAGSFLFYALGFIEFSHVYLLVLGSIGIAWLELSRTMHVISEQFITASLTRYLYPGLASIIILWMTPDTYESFYIVLFLIPFFIALPVLKHYKFNKNLTGSIRREVLIYFGMQVTYMAYIHIIKVVQNAIVNLEVVAYFSVGYMLVRLILLIPSYLSLAYLPGLSSNFASKDMELVKDKYEHIILTSTLITVNVVIFFWFHVGDIESFYGKGYVGLSKVLRYFLFLPFFITLIGPNGPILIAGGRVRQELINGALLIFLASTFTYSIGRGFPNLVVLAVVLAEMIVASRKRYLCTKQLGWKLVRARSLMSFMIFALLVYSTYSLLHRFNINNWLELPLQIGFSLLLIQCGYMFKKGRYEIIRL